MDVEREVQTLLAGLEAAKKRVLEHPSKNEYPRDFHRLYEWLEDKTFDLFAAIEHRNNDDIYIKIGELIICASRIAEFAFNEAQWENLSLKEDDDEVVSN